ncbi:MAG: ArnT family glycosyltransferase, partial [Nitrospirota bacterium]
SRTIPTAVALALFLLWITPGLLDRDLWKADEPYSFGLVHHIVETGDWVIPTIAGQPFMEKPPLFYLTAAGFVRLFSSWIEPHDAARLASALFMLLTTVFMGLAARELMGEKAAGMTIVLLVGSTGLQVTSHKLITDLALLTGIAAALYGFTLFLRRPALGGFWIGTGTGIGFMSKGLIAPGLTALLALALPLVNAEWRNRSYARSMLIALIASLPWLAVWPTVLYLRSPDLFVEWFWYQNIGRYFGFANVGRGFTPAFYLEQLPWYALPSLPIALWAVWRERRAWRERPELYVPLTAFLVMLTVFSLSTGMRNIYALPMLLPLALLAAGGLETLPERLGAAFNRISLVLFGSLAAIVWLSWIIDMTDTPSFAAQRLHRFEAHPAHAFNKFLFAAACVYSAAWIITVLRSRLLKHNFLFNWTMGTVLVWGLLMTLWLPSLDAASGYRPLFTALREKIPAGCRSVITEGLGESERALVDYYVNVTPRPLEGNGPWDCDMLLLESGKVTNYPPPGPDWRLVWQGRRPGDTPNRSKEIYTLFRREGGRKQCL